jgi:thermostable 8-oxoguanine DNA glycosylase
MDVKLHDLQYKILYCIIVAGKSAKFSNDVLKKIFSKKPISIEPFEYISRLISENKLDALLKYSKSGNYKKLNAAIPEIIKLDLVKCTIEDLEKIKGIGPKTARFFILWTRPNYKCAVLDTHVLKWLKLIGHNVPKSTPTKYKYNKIEKIFIEECDKRDISPHLLDKLIWEYYSKSGKIQNNLTYNIQLGDNK